MKTATLADEIANYSIHQLKNEVIQICEMTVVEQGEIRDIIRNAALHILGESRNDPKGI